MSTTQTLADRTQVRLITLLTRNALTGEPSALIVEIVIEPRLGEEPPR